MVSQKGWNFQKRIIKENIIACVKKVDATIVVGILIVFTISTLNNQTNVFINFRNED